MLKTYERSVSKKLLHFIVFSVNFPLQDAFRPPDMGHYYIEPSTHTFLIRLTMARNQRKQCEKPGSKFAQCISRGRCGIMDLHFQLTSEVLWQTY